MAPLSYYWIISFIYLVITKWDAQNTKKFFACLRSFENHDYVLRPELIRYWIPAPG